MCDCVRVTMWRERDVGVGARGGWEGREGGREREGRTFTVAAVTVAAAACSVPQPPAPRSRRAVTGLGLNATPYRARGSASQTRQTAGAVFQAEPATESSQSRLLSGAAVPVRRRA